MTRGGAESYFLKYPHNRSRSTTPPTAKYQYSWAAWPVQRIMSRTAVPPYPVFHGCLFLQGHVRPPLVDLLPVVHSPRPRTARLGKRGARETARILRAGRGTFRPCGSFFSRIAGSPARPRESVSCGPRLPTDRSPPGRGALRWYRLRPPESRAGSARIQRHRPEENRLSPRRPACLRHSFMLDFLVSTG